MLIILHDYAGLPVAEINKIQRQKGEYAQAVTAIRGGRLKQADALLRKLGWVIEGFGHDALVAEFAKAIEETKANGEKKSVLVVDPTHKDGDALVERLRAVLKEKGVITGEEKTFRRLKPLHWTDAQKSDASRYSGGETIQFFHNAGRFKSGDRVKASELLPELSTLKPKAFAVFAEAEVTFARGDRVRMTNGGWDATRKHRIDNGRVEVIKGFSRSGDIILSNGWLVSKDFAHWKNGLVSTSQSTQSKTEDIVLGSLNRASLGAMSLEQFLVTISRGRERGMVFTDLSQDELLDAVKRQDRRKSATELLRRKPQAAAPATSAEWVEARMRRFMERMKNAYRDWHRLAAASRERARQQRRHPQQKRGFSRG